MMRNEFAAHAAMSRGAPHGRVSTQHAVDAHRPAQAIADANGLPQTVFYHPEWAHSCACFGATILRDHRTRMLVTWLPADYFSGVTL